MLIIIFSLIFTSIFTNPGASKQEIPERIQVVEFEKNTDVRFKSGITSEALDEHFSGVLSGTGETFLEVQEHYNISATFLAGIATLESANGTSKLARSKNNVFGLKGKRFDSVEECIWYMGELLTNSNYYFKKGRTTVGKIQKVYAPHSDARNKKWSSDVISIANKLEKTYN